MAREIEFQDLPESIVLRIFSFTAERRIFNLFRLRRVCKRWLRLSEDPSLWRKIAFPNCDNLCYEVLKRVFSWCGNVRNVDLSNCGRMDDKCFELIADQCPNLEVLDLSGCRLLSDVGLAMLFKYCHRLRCLRITVYKSNVSPNVIEDLINACASLQELRVTCERDENSNEAEFFFCLNEKVLSAVQMNCNLKKVYFLNSGIDEEVIDVTNRKFDLLEFGLTGCMSLSNDVLSVISYSCPALQLLDVSYCPGIDDEGISIVAQSCQSLLHLIAKGCPCVTDVSIENVAKHCRLLQTLEVSGCELPRPAGNITDVAVQRIAEKCLNLCQLNVKWCQGVTDKGILSIASNCRSCLILTSAAVLGFLMHLLK